MEDIKRLTKERDAFLAEVMAWRAFTAAHKIAPGRWAVEYQAADFDAIYEARKATDAALRAMEGGAG